MSMNKRIAPWFLVTLYDADDCEVCTDEVQGLMNARTELHSMMRDRAHADAVRGTIEQRVGDAGVIVVDIRKPTEVQP